MTTTAEARDTIMSRINAAWLANPTSADIAIVWDDVPGAKPGQDGATEKPEPWVRFAIRHTVGEQETSGAAGNRRYVAAGIFTAQIFTPLGDGHTLADALVEIVKAELRAVVPACTVWFYYIRMAEIGEDGPWFNTNVDATFQYQERA